VKRTGTAAILPFAKVNRHPNFFKQIDGLKPSP